MGTGYDQGRIDERASLAASLLGGQSLDFEAGRLAERRRIMELIRRQGYDWSHDNRYSPLQHLLNALEAEIREER